MAAILEGNRLTLTGDVGDFGWGDYFTHSDVVLALAQVNEDDALDVIINSGGGIASEGAAIHALLSRRPGRTNVIVDGIAASAASLIAMAGDLVTMSIGSALMVHDPATITFGNSEAHDKSVEMLEALSTSYARVYAAKTGKTAEDCRTIMKQERWFTAEEAVDEGFADAVGETRSQPVAAFAYHEAYAHAPKKLAAMAKQKNWHLADAGTKAASAAPTSHQQEPSMTDKERADKLAAELAEMKAKSDAQAKTIESLTEDKSERERQDAIMALPEAEGRADQAKVLASTKGITAEAAKAILAAAPKVTASVVDDDAAEHERRRLNGEGLNGRGPSAPKAKGDRSILSASADRLNKRR
ncbi:head maturation protease, ClpP-related [Rhizobium halophytocola]|uniref:ATP-dependent Clp protease proteolytic subunit n=1 Tax=Rhizobium halophytocola TaxID=735519 RepID=A0ABS4E2G5_9HYPH|nr:head maturation protease, ClpP-related [Rhizobium halophytocola]MBP1852127.1 ATP-dependent protease ClpP protease subunit [Rhizobium halophytocola]